MYCTDTRFDDMIYPDCWRIPEIRYVTLKGHPEQQDFCFVWAYASSAEYIDRFVDNEIRHLFVDTCGTRNALFEQGAIGRENELR